MTVINQLTESAVNGAPIIGWRDILGKINTRGLGATEPAWGQIGSGSFFGYNWAVNDVCWIDYHIPHDIAPDEPIHFHAHWISDGTDTNIVKWEWSYTYAKGFNQGAFDLTTGTVITAEEAASGTAGQHMVTETAAVTISGLDEPDGMIKVRLRRVTNGGTENTDNIYMNVADVHYKSTNLGTISKAPNFYEAQE